MAKLTVKADSENNTLFLILAGIPTVDNIRKVKVVLEYELSLLAPGFKVFNDSREFSPINPLALLEFMEVCKMAYEKKPSKIARLLNPFSRMVFARGASDTSIIAREFTNVQNAVEFLGVENSLVFKSLYRPDLPKPGNQEIRPSA